MSQAWYSNRLVKIFLHLAAWLIIFSLPYLLSSPYDNHHLLPDKDATGFFYLNLSTNIIFVCLFYLNAYELVPRFVSRKRYIGYLMLLVVLFFLILGLNGLFFTMWIKTRTFSLLKSASFHLPTFLLTLAVSTTYQLIGDKVKDEKKEKEKHEENLKTELSFLRSQISPHFMFNVLNNIVALARLRSEQLEPTVIKLSSLMRYMLYETQEEKATLKKEIEYLHSYIDLQVQRFEDSVQVNVTIEDSAESYDIEPMLLIPFVENAFKHGIGMINDPQIDIRLKTEKDILYFYVANKYDSESEEIKDQAAGIGLSNVRRRLNLLYGNNQSLLVTQKDNWFIVSLQLKLH